MSNKRPPPRRIQAPRGVTIPDLTDVEPKSYGGMTYTQITEAMKMIQKVNDHVMMTGAMPASMRNFSQSELEEIRRTEREDVRAANKTPINLEREGRSLLHRDSNDEERVNIYFVRRLSVLLSQVSAHTVADTDGSGNRIYQAALTPTGFDELKRMRDQVRDWLRALERNEPDLDPATVTAISAEKSVALNRALRANRD